MRIKGEKGRPPRDLGPCSGVKQTGRFTLQMSAYDPKRTSDEAISRLSRKIVGSQYQGLVGLGLLFEELT